MQHELQWITFLEGKKLEIYRNEGTDSAGPIGVILFPTLFVVKKILKIKKKLRKMRARH